MKQFMMGSDKPVIPGQWLFQPCQLKWARNIIQNLPFPLSRQAGHRVGSYLNSMVPLIMNFINSPEGDDELKESGLQTFEALVVRCFREVTPFIPEVHVGVNNSFHSRGRCLAFIPMCVQKWQLQ